MKRCSGLNRRRLIKNTLAAGLLFHSGKGFSLTHTPQRSQAQLWLSAAGDTPDAYGLTWLRGDTAASSLAANTSSAFEKDQAPQASAVSSVKTGFRGHGVAMHPTKSNQVVMIARRPGTEGAVVNIETAQISHRFTLPKGHQFEGHGCFSHDGHWFYTSESRYHNGEGVVGVYAADTFERVNQFSSFGVGPHEIKMLPHISNRSPIMVIANGGLHTKPNTGRTVHNLATMAPSLVYINAQTGQLIEQVTLPESKASIRHLDVAEDGTVAIAMQVQRAGLQHTHLVDLAARHTLGEKVSTFQQPDILLQNLNDYLGSTVISNPYRVVGSTSPRGNLAAFWHLDTCELLGYYSLQDVCGIAVSADQTEFVLTNSFGHVRRLNAKTLTEHKQQRLHYPNTKWDNHLVALS